jgi:hypothetical protein
MLSSNRRQFLTCHRVPDQDRRGKVECAEHTQNVIGEPLIVVSGRRLARGAEPAARNVVDMPEPANVPALPCDFGLFFERNRRLYWLPFVFASFAISEKRDIPLRPPAANSLRVGAIARAPKFRRFLLALLQRNPYVP